MDIGIWLETSLAGSESRQVCLRRFLSELGAECASLPDLDARSPYAILGYDENGGFGNGNY